MTPEPLRASVPEGGYELALARPVDRLPGPGALPGGCLYEPKWDGFRVAVIVTGAGARVQSRNGKDLTAVFAELAAAAADQVPPGYVLDGEAVVFSGDRLDFDALQKRLVAGREIAALVRAKPASLAVFDLLAVDGQDIRSIPLRDRRALLTELARSWQAPLNLSPVTSDPDTAEQWLRDLPATGVEGLVIKGAGQAYAGGQRQWLKLRHRDTVEVLCGAVTGSLARPQEVVAGLVIDGELRIVGRSAPLKPAAARMLAAHLNASGDGHPWPELIKSAAMDRFNAGAEPTRIIRVEPVVVEVSADTAFTGTSFRHALRFLRPRPDMDPGDIELPAALR
ncbi:MULTISPECIES: ATP-dependent DNA ligase [unclassified Arthrobacter]|uniref:ATP-dependent DNA ligase n=1 Tax=unclassified Arthrobacter TaxID=235627 RepID=UPI001D13665F|nr:MULTISPECIES: ATP-dependent DNA ligase [unclassified Arthrobacter]MCC3274352.1 ATP-dependent DNA ligase [Arthrobacter sp. zg-Y20]MCC9178055.1 ATP-dependent DNA ligase [Arthrobacter sp. zg-Y750]MDK1314508.1 ATP-dependent DNA ligase [Arthrobacter sp. zg.Y20]WIB07491.1 ATP-dependent DNA ligase [Arthrobacter sp. zg-Y20]